MAAHQGEGSGPGQVLQSIRKTKPKDSVCDAGQCGVLSLCVVAKIQRVQAERAVQAGAAGSEQVSF